MRPYHGRQECVELIFPQSAALGKVHASPMWRRKRNASSQGRSYAEACSSDLQGLKPSFFTTITSGLKSRPPQPNRKTRTPETKLQIPLMIRATFLPLVSIEFPTDRVDQCPPSKVHRPSGPALSRFSGRRSLRGSTFLPRVML
jgi:hypothetical protein